MSTALQQLDSPHPGGPGTEPLLVVDGLTVQYGRGSGHKAVSDVSFSIGRGERVALIGESGSGKTSLGLATAGFLTHPDVIVSARSITFKGAPLAVSHRKRLPQSIPGLSMVFQDAMTSLDPVWTIGAQLVGALQSTSKSSKRDSTRVAERWLERVGLTDPARVMRSRPYELSGGMRQRVMIALALSAEPMLVIADEPTSALDASVSRATMQLLLELSRDLNTSLLIVSHDVRLCLEYSDRALVMYKGSIVDQGPSATLDRDATHPYARGLLACVPTLDSRKLRHLPTLKDFMPADSATTTVAEHGTAAA